MTAGAGSPWARARWSDLPDEILGNIHLKITSLRDRVRVTAVSRQWRATAALLPALPAAPLLLMPSRAGGTKHLCGGGPDDSWVIRVPDQAADKCLMGSHKGGWVATHDYRIGKLTLVNLFSRAKVGVCYPWPAYPRGDFSWSPVCHVIFSDDPTSSKSCILATIVNQLDKIALCKVGGRSGWTEHRCESQKMFMDIAFCNGDLYCLMEPGEELVRFKINREQDGSPIVTSIDKLTIQRRQGPIAYKRYIVELHGKPTMAIMSEWFPNLEPFFKVFELVDTDTCEAYQYKWTEVTSFSGYALFLGPRKSKAVHVPLGAEHRGFERNHIYYSDATGSRESNLRGDEVYSLRLDDASIMYCREDQNIGDGLGRTGYYMTGWENSSMWLEPPDM